MLGAQFEDGGHSDDDVLEVDIVEGFSLPFVLGSLGAPEFAGQLGAAVLPST